MMKIRPNIMHRRVRDRPDLVLIENLDKEHQQDVQRSEQRRQRREALIHERRKHLFATPEEKVEIIRESLKTRHRLEQARQAKEKALAQHESSATKAVQQHLTMVEEIDDMEQAARRAYLRNLCEENLKLAEYRRQMQAEAAQREKARERVTGGFYERWGRNAFT